jgi:hypothetical protein
MGQIKENQRLNDQLEIICINPKLRTRMKNTLKSMDVFEIVQR